MRIALGVLALIALAGLYALPPSFLNVEPSGVQLSPKGGLPGNPVENVLLKNISISYKGGLTKNDFRTQNGANPFFLRNGGYPEPSAHGIQPAWGLSMSYAKGIRLENVTMTLQQPDEREKIYLGPEVEDFEWK